MKYTNEYKKAAYKVCTTTKNFENVTNDELHAANEWAKELRFYADMSDDYKVTCAEKHAINVAMACAVEEMKKRGIY